MSVPAVVVLLPLLLLPGPPDRLPSSPSPGTLRAADAAGTLRAADAAGTLRAADAAGTSRAHDAVGTLRAAGAAYWWPVTPPRVVRGFDPPAQPWLPGHRGVDLASSAGAAVRAAGSGTVVHAQTLAGRGVVSVVHAGRLRTTYEPVTATVRAGDRVAAGDPIGTVEAGHPGCPETAVCLHWGLRRGGVYLDPLALLGAGRVRLLPLDGR